MTAAFCARGFWSAEKGETDAAIADCNEAIRLEPKCAEAYVVRSICYDKKGDETKAARDIAKAKELGFQPPKASSAETSL